MEALEGLRRRKPLALRPIRTTSSRAEDGGDGSAASGAYGGADGSVEGEPLSPAARLFHEPNFNVFIIAEMGCKTRIDAQLVREKLAVTLLRHPRFSSLQMVDSSTGDMKWVPTTVNLSDHVFVPEVDPTAAQPPEKFIEDYIAGLSTAAADFSKPLWDLHLLNVPTARAEAVGVFRIHHSLGDGVSLMSLLLACTRRISDPAMLPTIPAAPARPRSGGLWSAARLAWNTAADVAAFLATSAFLRDTDTAVKGVPVPGKARWRFVHRTVSLDDVKLVKNASKATINDVLMGTTMAALSRYLNRKYGEKRRAEGVAVEEDNLPKKVRLRATLLVNTRPSPGIHALAEMMEQGREAPWGNHVGYVLLPFPIGLRADPLDYVRAAKAVIDRKKHSLESVATCYIADFMFKLLGVKAASSLFHRAPASTTMSFSNMVGPVEEIGFYGHPMTHLAPGCFGQPNALMINWQSYMGKMTFVLSVDENTISDSYVLCDDFEESLRVMKDAVLSAGV